MSMSPVSIPYHLLVPFIIGISILVIVVLKRKVLFKQKYLKWFWTSFVVFIVVYLYFIGSALFVDIYYQWHLNSFDLNKDGFFSGSEITPEQKEAMFRLTNDVGRNFSFLTSFIPAIFVSVIFYVVGSISEKLNSKQKGANVA